MKILFSFLLLFTIQLKAAELPTPFGYKLGEKLTVFNSFDKKFTEIDNYRGKMEFFSNNELQFSFDHQNHMSGYKYLKSQIGARNPNPLFDLYELSMSPKTYTIISVSALKIYRQPKTQKEVEDFYRIDYLKCKNDLSLLEKKIRNKYQLKQILETEGDSDFFPGQKDLYVKRFESKEFQIQLDCAFDFFLYKSRSAMLRLIYSINNAGEILSADENILTDDGL